jgi:hypothetical protein
MCFLAPLPGATDKFEKGGAGEHGRSRQCHGTGNATPVPDELWSALRCS